MIRIGIAGTGFGLEHYRLLKNNPGAKVVAVFGRNPKKLQELEDGQVILTDNLDELLQRSDIDLIDICLPTKLHAEYIRKAVSGGKNVFCEMPLCETEEELEALSMTGTHRVYVSAFLKYFVEYEYLEQVVRSHRLGKLKTVSFKRYTPPIWGDLNAENLVLSFMLHEIDYAAWVFGSPAAVTTVNIFEKEKQSYIHSILQYPNLVVSLQASSFLPESHPLALGYEAFFEEGCLEFTGSFQGEQIVKRLMEYTKEKAEEIKLDGIYPFEAMLNDVVLCEANRTRSRLDIEVAGEAMQIAFEIKRQVAARHR